MSRSSIFFILCIILSTGTAPAQSVRVTAQSQGQGYAFKDNGICWVLLPRHLLDDLGRIQIETSPAPSVRGTGRAYADFWDGMDFAIGSVGQAAGSGACSAGLDSVTQTTVTAGSTLLGALRYVQEGGALTQFPMRIVDTSDHRTFVAEFTNPGDRPAQGLSGSFFFAGGLPVGMAIQTPDGSKRMTFIRIEELGFATRRWLAGRARAVVDVTKPDNVTAENSLPLTLFDYQTPPTSLDWGPENLTLGAGYYQFDFTRSTTFVVQIGDGDAVGVSRVRITSGGTGAKPLKIRVLTDPAVPGSSNPQRFHSGHMDPDGEFDTGRKSERFARRIIITVETVQGAGPVRIDRVEVN